MNSDPEDDEIPSLSQEAVLALQEFLSSQNQLGKSHTENCDIMKVNEITENWQLSQFWYSDETATELTEEICEGIPHAGKIALIGCPSLYYFVKKKIHSDNEVKLLDIDSRFTVYKDDFLMYDYNSPLPPHIPEGWEKTFDMVVLDPPFLSEECLTKSALTAKYLAKDKIIICTGAVLESDVQRLFNANKTNFQPKHKNNLGNEFACYINYRSRHLSLRTDFPA